MKCYKGFDKNLQCRGFQYEVGKTYETEKAEICSCGFHACENPLDVFSYYNPTSRFCEVDLDANDQTYDDSKRVGKKIHIETEIGLCGLIKAGIKFVLGKVDFKNADSANAGDRSTAANTGYGSTAAVSGEESIAFVSGYQSKAKGALGCWIVLTERDDNMHILSVKAFCVDGETVKPDVFYMLENGELKEVE